MIDTDKYECPSCGQVMPHISVHDYLLPYGPEDDDVIGIKKGDAICPEESCGKPVSKEGAALWQKRWDRRLQEEEWGNRNEAGERIPEHEQDPTVKIREKIHFYLQWGMGEKADKLRERHGVWD